MSKRNTRGEDHGSTAPTSVTRKRFDWSETRPSAAVAGYISAITGREQTDFAPLYETIDPDALDSLIDAPTHSSPVSISFSHAGHSVTVRSDGEVIVTAPSATLGH